MTIKLRMENGERRIIQMQKPIPNSQLSILNSQFSILNGPAHLFSFYLLLIKKITIL